MIFNIHIPKPPLNQFIESFIYYKDYNPIHSIERFLPDGNVNIVIDLTDTPKFIYDNHTLKEIQTCRNAWFSGIRNQYLTIPSGRDSEMFIINFHKGKAYPFVKMPLNELTDFVVDAELVLTNEILMMREGILNLQTLIEKFEFVETHLLKMFAKKLNVNPFVDFAVHQILTTPNLTTIEKIAKQVGYSQKHLIKLFKENVGLNPQSFLKVIRFQKAVTDIDFQKKANWTVIALDSGYYDQAHFINDFKNFSGFTPTQYIQSQSEFINYVAIE